MPVGPDHMRRRSKTPIVVAIIALFISGVALSIVAKNRPLIDGPLVQLVLLATPIGLVAGFLLSRRKPTWRLRITTFIGVSGIGAFVALVIVFGHLSACNAWLDDSTPRIHRVKVLEVGRRSKGNRWIEVESWRVRGTREDLLVPVDLAESAKELVITTRAGALGYEWIEDIRSP